MPADLALAFGGVACVWYLGAKCMALIWQRDEAAKDRDFYRRLWSTESHDHHHLLIAMIRRNTEDHDAR